MSLIFKSVPRWHRDVISSVWFLLKNVSDADITIHKNVLSESWNRDTFYEYEQLF